MNNSFMHQGDLVYRIEQLERELFKRTGGRSLERSSIGGGGLRVLDGGAVTIEGGDLVLRNEQGVVLARWGNVSFGGSSRGVEQNYSDGRRAWIIGGPPDQQTVAVYDHAGNYVMTTDALSGVGIGRPYLNYRLVPSWEAQSFGEGNGSLWPATENTTATKVMQGINPVWHPRVSIGVSTTTIGGGSATWRLDIGGVTAATSAGGATQVVSVPGWGSTITPGSSQGFDLFLHCSGGATRARIQCDRLFGLQS